MAQENVDVVRSALAAFNRSDFETAAGFLDPEIEWHPYLGALEGSVYRGPEAIVRMWSELTVNLSDLRLELKELIDLGDQVVAVVEARGMGTASGAEVHQSWAQLATLRDGLVVRVEPFPDKDAALAAAGAAAERRRS